MLFLFVEMNYTFISIKRQIMNTYISVTGVFLDIVVVRILVGS